MRSGCQLALGDPRGRSRHRLAGQGAMTRVLSNARPRPGQGNTRRARAALPPIEIQKLGRTLKALFEKIANFRLARVSNGPTEALNNLAKRIKRIGFGFRNFENYRIRALLYAGRRNWRVLGSIVVR
jgi:Transposase